MYSHASAVRIMMVVALAQSWTNASAALIQFETPVTPPQYNTTIGDPAQTTTPPNYRVVAGGASTSDSRTIVCTDGAGHYFSAQDTISYSISPATTTISAVANPNPVSVPGSSLGGTYTQTFSATSATVPQRYTVVKTISDSGPNHCGTFSATYALDVAPLITGAAGMWWINGEKPSQYLTSRILTATSGANSYAWSVTAGQVSVSLAATGTTSTKTTAANSVAVYARARSTQVRDVSITVTTNNVVSDSFMLTVRSPNKLTLQTSKENHPAQYDVPTGDIPNDPVCSTCVWVTHVTYSVRDQFNALLPFDIPLNEHWTSSPVPAGASTKTWPQPLANKGMVGPLVDPDRGAIDTIAVPSVATSYDPAAEPLHAPPSTKTVDQWNGEIYIGSGSEGSGCRVQTNVWERWIDHGRHPTSSRTSPAPTATCP